MLSIAAMKSGQGDYYLALGNEDYYLLGGEPPGRWLGSGSKELGLRGIVTEAALRNLFAGMTPDGARPLVQNAGKRRSPGYDLTFSAPKSVSVLWAVAPHDIRSGIEQAHQVGIEAAVPYVEQTSAYTRIGKRGRERVRVKLVAAAFDHGTSRLQDPQLHTHALIQSIGIHRDGSGALVGRELYVAKMAAGALYRSAMAAELVKLGFQIERHGNCFELTGVPKGLVKELSKRRREIEVVLQERGERDAKRAAMAALTTRERKEHIPRAELLDKWGSIAREHGFGARQIADLQARQAPEIDVKARAREALKEGLAKISESQAHFVERELITATAIAAQTKGVGADAVRQVVRDTLAKSEQVVKLGMVRDEQRYATKEMLAVEKRLIALAKKAQSDESHRASRVTIEKTFAQRPTLTEEQKAAIEHVTATPGNVKVINGLAGTGKTYAIDSCRAIWEREGKVVLGAALSGRAAAQLRDSADIPSDTIHRRLMDLKEGRLGLNHQTVMVVDEAGMTGTILLEKLASQVLKAGGKLVLAGDAKQLQPVEAGGPFRGIGERIGQAELTDIKRQREEWARDAIKSLVRGKTDVLRPYIERGLVTVAEDRREARQRLVDDWKQVALDKPADHLVLTSTRLDAVIVNRMAQQERLLAGKLEAESIEVGQERVHVNDRLLCTRNNRYFGVRNGDLGTLVHIDQDRRLLTVKLDDGERVWLPLKEYDHVQLGYAATTHKAQGMTVAANCYVLAGGPMQDRELTYVQISRARGETRLYTDRDEAGDELAELSRRVCQSRQKTLALDVQKEQQLRERQLELRQQIER